ncbi:hypothetical protein UFOVP338_71 [uncultured Caudovirales phage]|uniref:Terminase small subunit n=1 Tax=uncultured Caudovirales phage TaxID=2100421 RepID=A0A6J5LZ07_9CAUD|nr:hypothetical protein UFOVP338_71 [uncultured Caudovirales phage]
MPKGDDYSAYPPEAKQLATKLFELGMSRTDVVAEMRKTYPRLNPSTLNAWSINDEAFGVVYRNAIASKAQSVVTESMEQLEDVYAKASKMLDDADSDGGIDPNKATVVRLMMDTARHKKTTALMLLGKINKNYSDKTNNTVAFENLPTIQLEVVDNGVQDT